MDTAPVIVSKVFSATPGEIWTALTDTTAMKKWYFPLQTFEARPGFKFSFTGGPSEDRQYTHLCTVTEAVPQQRLCYTWRYEGYAGESLVCFTIESEPERTRVTVHHSGLETLEGEHPDFAKANFREGWTQIINVSLARFLEEEGNAAN